MKKLFIIPLLITLFCASITAQQIKIGYINSLELLAIMPESIEADKIIVALAAELDQQYKVYVTEYQKLIADYQDPSKGAEVKDIILEDIQAMENRIQEYETSSQAKINNKKAELYQPILAKATSVVQQVADENGFTHVFDSSTGAIIHAPEGDDMFQLVKTKMGIE